MYNFFFFFCYAYTIMKHRTGLSSPRRCYYNLFFKFDVPWNKVVSRSDDLFRLFVCFFFFKLFSRTAINAYRTVRRFLGFFFVFLFLLGKRTETRTYTIMYRWLLNTDRTSQTPTILQATRVFVVQYSTESKSSYGPIRWNVHKKSTK